MIRYASCCLLALVVSLGLGPSESGGASPIPGLTIEPANAVLIGADARQQLVVTLHERDGTLRDVTRECRFRVEPERAGLVTPSGILHPRADGPGVILFDYREFSARSAF